MNNRPFVALHRSMGTKTALGGRNWVGRVNGVAFAPLAAIAPFKCTTPETAVAAALLVRNGALVQPFCKVSAVVAVSAYDTPSREVKHCAFANEVSARTVTTPLGAIKSRPLVAPHMSTATYTFATGRRLTGMVNGTVFVPLVAMAPLRYTIPASDDAAAFLVLKGALVQPFFRVSAVDEVSAYDAPSSEVKHCAFENAPSDCTNTAPPD